MFKVLIIDDNLADINGIIRNIDWETLGINVCGVAYNGKEGYKKAIELEPDFIIADISMPLMNGIDMTREIKNRIKNIKFIFISCFDKFDFAKSAIELEVDRYILKPINLTELTEALEHLVEIQKEEEIKKITEQDLKLKIQESLPLLVEDFYCHLLYGKLTNEQEILNKMKYLNLDVEFKCYTLFIIEIDNYHLNYAESSIDEKYLLTEKIKLCINQTILKERQGFVIKNEFNNVVIILFYNNNENIDDITNQNYIYANECKEYINNALEIKVSIGISQVGNLMKDIPYQFQSAQEAIKSKFYSNGNSIISANEVVERTSEKQINLNMIKEKLNIIFEDGDVNAIDDFIKNYYNTSNNLSQYYLKTLSYSIVNVIQILLLERNLSYKDIFDDEYMVWGKLSKFETILDIKQWIKNIIISIIELLEKRDTSRFEKIVNDIIKIIDEQYGDLNNIGDITRMLDISSSYANFIFKQQTGKTIFDYLIKRKMEEAKKKLHDPYCRICDIADELGYKSNAYFTSVFKKYIGITPKEYRKRYSK